MESNENKDQIERVLLDNNLTEMELLEELVKIQKEQNKQIKRISNNVAFFFWIFMISFGITISFLATI